MPLAKEDAFHELKNGPHTHVDSRDLDIQVGDGLWHQHVRYVYDAAAERTQQRIRGGQVGGDIIGVP